MLTTENKNDYVRARITLDIKVKSQTILQELGMSQSEYYRLCLRKLIEEGGIPFEVKLPNAVTKKAIKEADDILHGRHKAKSYKTVSDLRKDLDA